MSYFHRIQRWAAARPRRARWLITTISVIVSVIFFEFGLWLSNTDIELSIIFPISILFFSAWAYYGSPKKRKDKDYSSSAKKNLYRRRRVHLFCSFLGGFLLWFSVGNNCIKILELSENNIYFTEKQWFSEAALVYPTSYLLQTEKTWNKTLKKHFKNRST